MAIEITEFADVNISVSPVGVQSGNFGILGFLTNDDDDVIPGKEITPSERARAYTSLNSVSEDWETTSEVYKAATAFYGQTPTPRDFTVLMTYKVAQPASLTAGVTVIDAVSLEDSSWNGSGVITMTIGVEEVAITDFSLSGQVGYTAQAAHLESVLDAIAVGTTVSHSGGAFVITAPDGVTTITDATGDAASDLGLLVWQLQGISQGTAAETPVDGLASNLAAGKEWVGTVTHREYRDQTGGAVGTSTLEIAQWCEAAKRILCNTSNNLAVLGSSTSDIISQLKDASLRFSLSTFSKNPDIYPSASVFGRVASVNFSAIGTTITLNLKQMPGITAEDFTPAEFATLRSKNGSAVVKIGKSVSAYTDSRMASGTWLDTTHGLMWLENRCETDLFNLLYVTNTKVPFTQVGINTVVATLERSLDAAVRNGLAGPGFLSDGTFLSEGYRVTSIPLDEVPVSDVGNRIYSGLSFVIKGAGALHEVEVAGSFTE